MEAVPPRRPPTATAKEDRQAMAGQWDRACRCALGRHAFRVSSGGAARKQGHRLGGMIAGCCLTEKEQPKDGYGTAIQRICCRDRVTNLSSVTAGAKQGGENQ